MILPYTIFRKFEDNSDNKNDALISSMYNDLVLKKKRDIFGTLFVFIFNFWDFCWSLAVLVNFNQCNIGSNSKQTVDMNLGYVVDSHDEQNNVQKKKLSVFYFALCIFTKNKDPTTKIDDKHADLLMEKKLNSFIDLCWKKRCSSSPNHSYHPKRVSVVIFQNQIPFRHNTVF